MGEMTTGGAMGAPESGETTSDTATHKDLVTNTSIHSHLCSEREMSCLTFNVERGGARGGTALVLGLTVVDSCILREDLDQQQCVLVAIVKELALEARGQSLGVLVPEDLWCRNAAHLNREASGLPGLHRLRLHVTEDLGRLWD